MRTNISKQLGLPVALPRAKAPSIEKQLGFVAEYDKSLDSSNLNFFAENDKYFNATGEEKTSKSITRVVLILSKRHWWVLK